MKWLIIALLLQCFTTLQLTAFESGVFAFTTHQNTCNHTASLANNNPCCLLHQHIKCIGLQVYQWYGIQPQGNINLNAVKSNTKLALAIGMSYQSMNNLKQMQLGCGIGLSINPHFIIGGQLQGNINQWETYKGFIVSINLACKWQISKRLTWITLLEQAPILKQDNLVNRALPKLSIAIQKQLSSNVCLQINLANSILGQLILGGHLHIVQGKKQWVFSLSDNIQQTGLAIQSNNQKHWNWGLGYRYHWQLGFSTHSQLTYAF
jgi:hypothetical protein